MEFETFKNSGGCFWKHITCYKVIKNYAGHKFSHLQQCPFNSIAFIVNLMMRHDTQAWCCRNLRGTSRHQKLVPEMKRSIAHAVLYWQELIPYYQSLSRVISKICFSRSCSPSQVAKQTFFRILLTCRHTLVTQNCRVSVRLHHCKKEC